MAGDQRRNRPGRHGSEAESGDMSARLRLEHLRRSFTKFRRAHRPRTRIPRELREAALEALRCGAAELEVRRACRALSYLAGNRELRLRLNELGRELRRALGITRSSERRRSGEPLAVVGRAEARSATDERQRLEAQRDRSDRLSKWHDRLTKRHRDKARRSEERLAKMKKEPKSDPMVEAEQQGPSALELQLHEQMPVEQIELTREQEADVEEHKGDIAPLRPLANLFDKLKTVHTR